MALPKRGATHRQNKTRAKSKRESRVEPHDSDSAMVYRLQNRQHNAKMRATLQHNPLYATQVTHRIPVLAIRYQLSDEDKLIVDIVNRWERKDKIRSKIRPFVSGA